MPRLALNPDKIVFQRRPVKKTLRKRLNACVNLLKQSKWLAPDEFQVLEYGHVTINTERLHHFIREHAWDLLRRFGLRGLVVILGPAQFRQVADGVSRETYLNYDFTHNYDDPLLYGMRLIVLPWLDGVVCVPKEYLPTK